MSKSILTALVAVLLASCSLPTVTPVPTRDGVQEPTVPIQTVFPTLSVPTETPGPAGTAQPTNQPGRPPGTPAASGPTNPLTGLRVASPALLERRPLLVKVENLPRSSRPQHGLSYADMVYEYYTELGSTRFAALFYGQDAEVVGPIRSARFFDAHLVRMYKAVFAFGSAYQDLLNSLRRAEFADRLVIELRGNCPPMCRVDPNGRNMLTTNTGQLSQYATRVGLDNRAQDLSGMEFDPASPQGGTPASRVYVRFSSAVYNRWDYDPASGRYLRWSDTQNAESPTAETYAQLTDAETKTPVGAENVVVIQVPYFYIVRNPDVEVLDADFFGTGPAYVNRDGQMVEVKWRRQQADSVLEFIQEDGSAFALKPGVTWVEVLSSRSRMTPVEGGVRFQFVTP